MDRRSVVTGDDIVAGLRLLGVAEGHLLFVHASLSRLGHVEGGADALIDALLRTVGEAGTVAMPGFTFQLNDLPDPVFDVRHTPVWASKVYERFRQRPGVCRSHHASHSVLALGAQASALTSEHSAYPCQAPSPFVKLAEWGGQILLLGVCHNSSTTFHAVEEQESLFYVSYAEAPGAVIIDEWGDRRPLPTMRHQMSRRYDFNRMDEVLKREGIQRETVIGDAVVRCVEARGMCEATVAAVRADPEALLLQGPERVTIPVTRAELGARST